MIVFIFSMSVRLWLCMFIGWGGRPEAPHQSFGSRTWTTRGKSLFCGNTKKIKASCVCQTVLGKEALSVGWGGACLSFWRFDFPSRWFLGVSLWHHYDLPPSVWRSLSGECERPTVRDPAETVLCPLVVQGVLQKSTEGQRQKAFWVFAGGF